MPGYLIGGGGGNRTFHQLNQFNKLEGKRAQIVP